MSRLIENLADARSVLFVPGDRPDRFAKAAASGADLIVLDLEDAVAPDAKSTARDAVDRRLSTSPQVIVRINATDTAWFAADIAMVSRYPCAVMLPKTHSAEHVTTVAEHLAPATPVIALIETAAGIQRAAEICACEPVVRAAFGSIDLSAELGIDPDDRQALLHARSTLVLAAAAAGQPAPWDGVSTVVHEDESVAADASRAARVGFGGKLCIHPRQVPIVNAQFQPSPAEQAWAQQVLAAVAACDGGACLVDGRMVDKPVIDRAARLMARARVE
ncbi:CoA ester lyase [Mycobacterium sp. CBMA 234]|uniref:HpcH/HpaI aldolase/citrate lyase family protein n=1 Tax=Mycolicibacterium sp. CBMA 234 TaxID=1918495 RepID=UPI0012DFAA36|nr:CoA ester lyase [Mycolicibacterium sp. CBMA 234]MUL67876.1 CoA ester lyase [Mycolicibacterium sp. CBMA 234]